MHDRKESVETVDHLLGRSLPVLEREPADANLRAAGGREMVGDGGWRVMAGDGG